MPSIKDVAKLAGVAVTTVSRVLNNRGYISEKTRKKVFEAMKELNYQPNEIARSLYRKKTNLLGLIVPDVSHPFFGELTKYIEYFAYKNGYKLLLCNSYMDCSNEKEYIDMLKSNKVDGIIMGSHTLDTSFYDNLEMPIVAFDRFLSSRIPYITSDNYTGGVLATKFLIEKGCKKIAHISGSLELNTPANKRCNGFLDVVKSEKIDYIIIETKLNEFSHEEYQRIAVDLLKKHPDIDGIFASSDMIAAAVISVSELLKKKVPENLKVVGFDDINIASLTVPSITTIRQPIERMAHRAVELIIKQIYYEEYEIENVFDVMLVERRSA